MNDEFFNLLSESDPITLLEITPSYGVTSNTVLPPPYGDDAMQTELEPQQISSSSQQSPFAKMVIY